MLSVTSYLSGDMEVVYTSDSCDSDTREQKTINLAHNSRKDVEVELDRICESNRKVHYDIETVLLNHNQLTQFPVTLAVFKNLQTLDLSSNHLTVIPSNIQACKSLTTLIVKNNLLDNKSLPKTLQPLESLKELNLSGNLFTHFPDQVIELKSLKYLYLGGNLIANVPKEIGKLHNLQLLSIGGNHLSEIPESVGNLNHLNALILCDNQIEHLPTSIAKLKTLKSLLLHKNKLTTLPRDIITLKNLTELSLRENPLVNRFVMDMSLNPSSLLEICARVVKGHRLANEMGPDELPKTLIEYLSTGNCCVNPKCKGVYFDNRVEHIKFVDFCGKYRIPLLQYLCSSKCIEGASSSSSSSSVGVRNERMMKKVLLG